jgi:hypothetical protein
VTPLDPPDATKGAVFVRKTELQGVVTATVTPFSSFDAFLADIGAAFNALGVPTRTLLHASDYPNPALMQALVLQLKTGGMRGFVFNCNAKDELLLGRDALGRPLTIHDAWKIPLLALVVDHPAVQFEALKRAPEHAVIGLVDEGHLAFFDRAGLRPRARVFCPHGGPEPLAEQREARDRSIDLLFVGGVVDPGPSAPWLDRVAGSDRRRRAALTAAFEAVYDGGIEVYQAIAGAFESRGLDAAPAAVAGLVAAVDERATEVRRLEVLRAMTDRRVVILGAAPIPALAHHDMRGPSLFPQSLRAMADARILINSRWTYGRGAHERLFYGLSRGAVGATEASSFLAEDLDRGLGMVALPKDPSRINDLLAGLCEDPDRIDALRVRGLAEYPARHTWRERMTRMLGALAGLPWP